MNKKILFLYPPFAFPISPYLAPILLNSILIKNSFDSNFKDLNVKFWIDCLLNKNHLYSCFDEFLNKVHIINTNRFEFKDENEKYFIKKQLKDSNLFIQNYTELIHKSIAEIDVAVDVLKSKKEFYNVNKFYNALSTIKNIQEIFFKTFFISVSLNVKIGYRFDTLNYFAKNELLNPFYNYFADKIKKGFFDKYDVICISQPFACQTLACFTLMNLLKQKTNKTICIGGNYINRLSNTLKNNTELFDNYLDYILTGLGEESIISFANFINKKQQPAKVAGLIYKNDNKIIQNSPQTFLSNIRKRVELKLDTVNFDDYLIPEIVFPIQVSKGCPWKKCTFCVFHEGKTQYQIAPPSQIAKEIANLYKKYGISKFEFVDESLSPKYYYKFAKEIIKLGINVNYYGFARFEEGFTSKILKTMYKSGFKMFEWGYETPSKRIMKIFNKGIILDSRIPTLNRADKAGIWNHCLTIVNIPFETTEEEKYDSKVYEKYSRLFHSRQMADFILYKNTNISKYASKYGINNVLDKGDMALELFYENEKTEKYKDDIYDLYKNTLWYFTIKLGFDEYLFLYVAKLGKENCLKLKKNKYKEN